MPTPTSSEKPSTQRVTERSQKGRAGTLDKAKSRHAITIARPVAEVYTFWRDFSNLSRFMKDLSEVQILSPTRSRWKVELKGGQKIEWDAEITEEIPGQLISWASLPDAKIKTQGSIHFEQAPAERGTIVSLSMDYSVPGGALTEWITYFTGEDPNTLVITNLKRLKGLLETGEIATTEGQPSGRDHDATPVLRH